MPSYPNGRFPLSLFEHLEGNVYLPPATAERWRRFRQDVYDETGVWLRITPDRSGLGGWNGYRPYAAQVEYKRKLGPLAAAPGKSSHGGVYNGVDCFAFDVDNWGMVPWSIYKRLANKHGLTVDFVKPREGWHVGDFDPWTMPPNSGGGTPTDTDNETSVEEEEEDEEMMKGAWYKRSDGKTAYMLFNEVSGFYVEHSGVESGYNNAIAINWETNSWPEITQAHATVIKRSLDAIRRTAVTGSLSVDITE